MEKLIFQPFRDLDLKNIIFDLGGVILNIDYRLTIDAFIRLGFNDFELAFSQAQQLNLFDNLDKGLITPNEFREGLRTLAPIELSDQQIDDAWNAMLLDFPNQRLHLLDCLKTQYNTFLLSNTNAIHFEEYNKILDKNFSLKNLSKYFLKEYYSHFIHMRKPNAEVFQLIINENNLKPHQTLFIDDSIQHVEGAKKLGIFAYHLNIPKGESIDKLFYFKSIGRKE